ncbi:delta(24)-sterol reductase-like [Tigriopus californicus]|nr:delta(24)-sterol reductase-like [Tigriopus californicus]
MVVASEIMEQPHWSDFVRLFLIFVVSAPISFLRQVKENLRLHSTFQKQENALKSHEDRVKNVQKQVRAWSESGAKVPMCSSRPSAKSISQMQTMAYKDTMYRIDIDLPNILSIDEDKGLVRIEPMVTVGQLNDFLIQRGWTMPVVAELDDLTMGGLVMGGGIEVTSHKHGFFQCVCKSYEMVMSDGSVLVCSDTVNRDLFATIPWSYGTVGILVSMEIQITPYKPFLELKYVPVKRKHQAIQLLRGETVRGFYDTLEGFMFSAEEGVVMMGRYVDQPGDIPLNRIGRWFKPWFYEHVRSFLKSGEGVEVVPTLDFFHRHNKPIFWLLRYILPWAHQPAFRYLFGWIFPLPLSLINNLRNKLANPEWFRNFVLQDYIVPVEHVAKVLELNETEFHIYPVWLCPTRHLDCSEYRTHSPQDILIDVGIYGFEERRGDRKLGQRRLEDFTVDNQGFVFLYAETDLSREQFDKMYKTYSYKYEEVRRKYECERAFPHVFNKISKVGRQSFCK